MGGVVLVIVALATFCMSGFVGACVALALSLCGFPLLAVGVFAASLVLGGFLTFELFR